MKMRARLFAPPVSVALLGAAFFGAQAQDGEKIDTDAELARLRNPDMEVRVEALRTLMTSLDPRLPEALLPLLKDEGNSIRRLAARAVGSRWWQINNDRVDGFVKVLKQNANAGEDHYDENNMARRAIGLLQRDYASDMFSRSPNGRWVIYERRGLPCLIDTESGSEELLGWSEDGSGWLSASWSNGTLDTSALWHPKRELVALDMIVSRKASTVWLWQHTKGLLALSTDDFANALGIRSEDIFGPGGFFIEMNGWKGDDLMIGLFYGTESRDDIIDYEASLAWNAESRVLRLLSRKKVE